MYSLTVHDDVYEDIKNLWRKSPTVAKEALALINELSGSQDKLDTLTIHGYGDDQTAPYSISKVQEYWKDGLDIWRIKIWALEDVTLRYRIIYVYEWRKQIYHILAIAPRSFNYERDHPITQRVLRACYLLFH